MRPAASYTPGYMSYARRSRFWYPRRRTRRRRMPKRMYGRRRRVRRQRRPMVVMPRVRDEMKTHDKAISFSIANDATTAQAMAVLNEVARNTSAITRIGKKIVMKALQIRGYLQANTATLLDKVAILLVYVRSNNNDSLLPPFDSVLESQSAIALSKRDNASKFKILRRWDYTIAGNNTGTGNQTDKSNFVFEEYITFKKPLITQWSTDSENGNYATMERGGLLLMGVGYANNMASLIYPTFAANSRLYFHETDGYAY